MRQSSNKPWHITSMNLTHNHKPTSRTTAAYAERGANISDEHRRFIKACAMCLLKPKDIIALLGSMYDNVPHITQQDVRNIAYHGQAPATEDANAVLQILVELQQEDPNWYFKYETNDAGQLTHLFWMSPRQREIAGDLHALSVDT